MDDSLRDTMRHELATLNDEAKRLHPSPAYDEKHQLINEILDELVGR